MGEVDVIDLRLAGSQLAQDAGLDLATRERDGVRQARERDHPVARHEAARMAGSESSFEPAHQQEVRVGDAVAHLDVVFQRHRRDRVGVRLAPALKLGEHAGSIVY